MECLEGDKVVNATYNITVKDSAQVAIGNNACIINYCTADKPNEKAVCSIQDFTGKLKSSIKKQTDFQPRLRKDKKVKTDDIFTSVTIQRGPKQSQADESHRSRSASEDQFQGTQSSTLLQKCSEIFIFPQKDSSSTAVINNGNPKKILTVGKPGIGKTFFCQKLVRDWAHDRLFQRDEYLSAPDFQFCYLLTFRQLSLLGDETLTLHEILNRSSTLDEQSVIDEAMFHSIMQHPEKLLLIIDGYDEYKHRDEITGDFETKFPNDPHQKMPVAAVVAKLLKGKMLRECFVMVTSRPGQAERLLEENDFEAKVEILGFSSQQVVEYVKKFFKGNDGVMNAVLEHINTNGILVGFAHIPVVCFLMCCLLEWHMGGSNTRHNLPITLTDLYHQVAMMFIKKHHTRIKYSRITESDAKEILDKLAELAVGLSQEERFIFDEDNLRKMDLSDEEITNLKESGLLDCCPGVRSSPFDDAPLEYSFTHLTIQEFLVAHCLVKRKEIPEKGGKTSDVTFQFIAGLLSKEKDELLMAKVLECVKPLNDMYDPKRVLTLKCLHEYRDVELAKHTISDIFDKYCNSRGICVFYGLTDIDCVSVSFLLDVISILSEERASNPPTSPTEDMKDSFTITAFGLINSNLTSSGVKQLCSSLSSQRSIFRLQLWNCELDDDCVKIICEMLPTSRITHLYLPSNHITDEGVQHISSVIRQNNGFPEYLNLANNKITEECQDDLRSLVKQYRPDAEDVLYAGSRKRR